MSYVGLLIAAAGLVLLVWTVSAPMRKRRESSNSEGVVAEGRVVHLKEWMHEGHRRCQVEYAYGVSNPETGEEKTLTGKSICIPKIFDHLELNAPVKVRYLPQKPEFSRPLFDD